MDIAEVRRKFPQYDDLSDEELAKGLHKKFYSDMSFDDFSAKIGLVNTAEEPDMAISHSPMMAQAHEAPQRLWPINPQAAQELRQSIVNPSIRMAIEGGGTTMAELAALPTGPLGMLGAGTAGYIASKRAADALLGEKSQPLLEEAKTGAMMSMAGQVLAPAFMMVKRGGKWVVDTSKQALSRAFTKEGTEAAAGKKFVANTNVGDFYAKNEAEAKAIEKEIPGLKFTYGQRTYDPDAIKLERAMTRQGKAEQETKRVALNTEAIRDYFGKNFSGQGIDDFLSQANMVRGKINMTAEQAQQLANQTARNLPQVSPEVTGQRALDVLSQGKKEAKAAAGKLYDEVPRDTKIDVTGMINDFKGIRKKIGKYESPENVPNIVNRIANVKTKIEPTTQAGHPASPAGAADKKVTAKIGDLQELNSEIKAQIRQLESTPGSNQRYLARLKQSKKAIDRAIEGAKGAEELNVANKFFRKEVIEKYRSGAVGEVLTRGRSGEVSKVPISRIPGKFFSTGNLSAADQFIKAAGPDAAPIMRDYAAYDMLQSVTDIEGNVVTSKLNGWLTKNRKLLDKFGIQKDFNDVFKAQQIAEKAKQNAIGFEKNAANIALNSDANLAVKNSLKATKGRSMSNAARELVDATQGDKAALNGIQNALADTIIDDVRTTAYTIAGDPRVSHAQLDRIMRKYEPAMRVIYKDNPDKLRALRKIQKAYRMEVRNKTSPLGGGSDTAENIWTKMMGINLLYRPVVIAKGIFNVAKGMDKNQMESILLDALYNPDTADKIVNLYRMKYKPGIPQIKIEEKAKSVFDDLYRNIMRRAQLKTAAGITGIGVSAKGEQE